MSAPYVVPAEHKPVMRDVLAILTACINNDIPAVIEISVECDDPRQVIAGVAGVLAGILPEWAQRMGVDDLSGLWSVAATEANRRMEAGEPFDDCR
jgi:hypothetical protein